MTTKNTKLTIGIADGIKSGYTHRVLYWGVLGAVVFRLIFVLIGTSLFAMGPYVEVVFAIVIFLSAYMMLKKKDTEELTDFSAHGAYRLVKSFVPLYPKLVGHNFFISHKHVLEELKKEENKNIVLKKTGFISMEHSLRLIVIDMCYYIVIV